MCTHVHVSLLKKVSTAAVLLTVASMRGVIKLLSDADVQNLLIMSN